MSYTPTSGQGTAAVTATVSNTVANFGSGSGTSAGPTTTTTQATEVYLAGQLNILNHGTTPVHP